VGNLAFLPQANLRRGPRTHQNRAQIRLRQIPAIRSTYGVLRVHAGSQIARVRADFDRFSAMSEPRETGWWSRRDLNPRPLVLVFQRDRERIGSPLRPCARDAHLPRPHSTWFNEVSEDQLYCTRKLRKCDEVFPIFRHY